MRRILLVALVGTTVALGAGGALGEDGPPGLDWDKRADAFQTPNRAGAGLESRQGTCNGDVELEFAWHAARQRDPSLPPLAAVEQEILARSGPGGGEAYLLKIRELAQRHSYRAGGGGVRVDAPGGRPRAPQDTLSEAKAAVERGEPTRLLLWGTREEVDRSGQVVARRVLHTVTAYQTAQADGTVGLRVADSSAPGRSGMLVVDERPGAKPGWEEVTEGDLGRVRWDRVDRITSPPGDPEVYRRLLDAARRGVPAKQIEATLGLDPVPPPPVGAVTKDPKAGGVWIAFDPAAYEGVVDEAAVETWIERAQAFLEGEGGEGLALSREPRTESARLVSLRAALASGAATLAPLTRVRGYVLASDGDVWLAGPAEEGREPVPLDLLTVALRTVWQRGLAPFVSLDPDPQDMGGPPKRRMGQIPEDLRESAFVRVLFAADYAMKELVLGARAVEVEGWRSVRELIAERRPAAAGVVVRMWLTPLSAPVADVLETRGETGTAVWFQSRVQALTEEMAAAGGVLAGKGSSDPVFAESAALFTARYDDLAERVPVLRRLAVAFDCAKACALWRARGVASEVLGAVAARVPASGGPAPEDEPRAPFPGVGVLPVEGTDFVLSGGARAKARVRPQGVVATERLAPLLDAAAAGEGGPVELEFPAVLDLDASAAAGADAELSFTAALALLRGGEWAKADERLTRVLAVDPADGDAWMLRGVVRLADGRDAEGRADLERAVEIDRRFLAVRALVRVGAGEREAGLADAVEAERVAPEDEAMLPLAAFARIRALDFEGAEAALRRLRALAPGHPAGQDLSNELALWRSLPRERAEARLRMIREVPQGLQRLLVAGGQAMAADPAGAIPLLEQALAAAQEATEPAVRDLSVAERARFLLGLAAWQALPRPVEMYEAEFVAEATRPVRAQADALVAAHPAWPSGWVLRASLAAAAEPAEDAVAAFAEAVARAGNPDPILDDMAPQWGTRSMTAMLGTGVAWGLWERGLDASPVLEGLARLVPGTAASRAFALLARRPTANLAVLLQERSRGGDTEDPRALLEVLREVEAVLDAEPASDAVGQWFLQVFHKAYLPLEQEAGRDAPRLLAATLKFLRSTEGVEPSFAFAEPILHLRAAAWGMAAAAVAAAAQGDLQARFEPMGERLYKAAEAGDGAATKAALADLARGVRAEFPGIRDRVARLAQQVERDASARARDAVLLQLAAMQRPMAAAIGSPREVERLEAVAGVAGSAELADYLAAAREAAAAGLFVAEAPEAVLARVVAAPHDAVEAGTVLRFLPFAKEMAGSLFPDAEPPVDFDRAQRELQARLRMQAFAPADEARPGGAALPRGTPPGGDGGPRRENGVPLGLLAGAAAAVVVVVLLAARQRKA